MNKIKLKQFHRDNILEVADRLFLENGFEKTTVDMIAKEADYSKPTIYAYFSSKEEIFAYNLLVHIGEYHDNLKSKIENSENAVGAYLNCCWETVRLRRESPVYFSGIAGSLDYGKSSLPGEPADEITALSRKINSMVAGLFGKAAGEGLIVGGIDIKSAYAYVWSCVMGLAVSPNLAPEKFENENEYKRTLEQCFLNVIKAFVKE